MLNTIILGWIGTWQIVLIVAVVLLLFGGKKIPELMKGLGQGVKEFKDATDKEGEEKDQKGEKESKKNIEKNQDDSNRDKGS